MLAISDKRISAKVKEEIIAIVEYLNSRFDEYHLAHKDSFGDREFQRLTDQQKYAITNDEKNRVLGLTEESLTPLVEENRDVEIAEIILQQLGGSRRLTAMIGAKYFSAIKNGLSFRFSARAKNGTNYVKIVLNSKDLYDVEFGSIRGSSFKVKNEFNDIYADQLIEIFEDTTGLYLSL